MRIVVTFNETPNDGDELASLGAWMAEAADDVIDIRGPWAFEPQELLLVLLIGGMFFLTFVPWVAAALVLLFVAVVALDDIAAGMLDAWLAKRRR